MFLPGGDVSTGRELKKRREKSPAPSNFPASDLTICDEVSEIPPNECAALVSLYQSTNGSGWTRQDGWLATNTPCSWMWYAVRRNTCYLSDNHLIGSIPSALGNLASLQAHMSYNQLSGSIPSELGNPGQPAIPRSALEPTERHPPELGNLGNPAVSRLSVDQLGFRRVGQPGQPVSRPVCQPTERHPARVETWRPPGLDLSFNQLSGIPPALVNLDNLQYLYLFSNRLSSSIPSELTTTCGLTCKT